MFTFRCNLRRAGEASKPRLLSVYSVCLGLYLNSCTRTCGNLAVPVIQLFTTYNRFLVASVMTHW